MSRAVQQMFDGIAPTYDALNRVLSLGIDRSWRRRAIAALGEIRDRPVLDVCAGTLDLACHVYPVSKPDIITTHFGRVDVVVVARRGHPAFRKPLTVEGFSELGFSGSGAMAMLAISRQRRTNARARRTNVSSSASLIASAK